MHVVICDAGGGKGEGKMGFWVRGKAIADGDEAVNERENGP